MIASIRNHDIMGLVRRINRFLIEIGKSQSASISGMRQADLGRLKSYQVSLATYKAWIIAQPELDLPETHPEDYAIPDAPEVVASESESIADIAIMLGKMRDELVASQSAQLATGLISHDATRFDAILAKINAFIADYVEPTTPLDLPESSPVVQ